MVKCHLWCFSYSGPLNVMKKTLSWHLKLIAAVVVASFSVSGLIYKVWSPFFWTFSFFFCFCWVFLCECFVQVCHTSCSKPQGKKSSSCRSIAQSPRLDTGRRQRAAAAVHQSPQTLSSLREWTTSVTGKLSRLNFLVFGFNFVFSCLNVSVALLLFKINMFIKKYWLSHTGKGSTPALLFIFYLLCTSISESRLFAVLRFKFQMWEKSCGTETGHWAEKQRNSVWWLIVLIVFKTWWWKCQQQFSQL